MSRVIPLPLKRVAERQQISPTCLLSFLNLLYHESFYCSPYSFCWKISHFFVGFVLFVHRESAGDAQTCTQTPSVFKNHSIVVEFIEIWVDVAAATSTCAVEEISCYHPGICRVLSNYSFCCSLHRPGIDLQEEGGRYTWGRGAAGGEK